MTRTIGQTTSRPQQQTGMLKALLLTGSIIATLGGARLLALQEGGQTETAVTSPVAVTIVTVPPADNMNIAMPPTGRGVQLELPPIPQAVKPQIQPVTRTRSSQ